MATDVQVRFGASIGELISGVDKVKEAIKSVQEPVDALNEKFNRLAEIAGISFSVEALKSFVESMSELGEKTEISMAQLGISAEAVTRFAGVAKLSGTDLASVQTSIERLSLRVQESAKDAFSPAAEALRALGLSAKELANLPTDQYFEKIIEAVGRFNPSLNLTTALTAAGGRGITSLLPILLEGTEHYHELAEAVERTGSVLTGSQAKALAESHEKLELLSLSMQGLGVRIFETFKPAIDSAVQGLTNLVQSISGGDIRNAANTVALAVINIAQGVAIFFVNMRESIERMVESTIDSSRVLTALAGAVRVVNDFFNSQLETLRLLTGGSKETAVAIDNIGIAADVARAKIAGYGAAAKAAVESVMKPGAMDDAVAEFNRLAEAQHKLNMGPLDSEAKNRQAAEAAAIREQIKAAETAYQIKVDQLNSEVKLSQITEDQKAAAQRVALNARTLAESGAYDALLGIYKSDAAQYAKIQAEKLQMLMQATRDGLKVQQQQLETDTKQWQSALAPLQSAWDSQLRGLLAGTTTWAQAMKSIVGDLILDIIKKLEALAIEKAALALASAVGSPKSLLNLSAISADTGQAFAGFAAFLSPTLGPAAIPAAEALAATVAAQATALSVPALDIGGYVLTSGLANIHAGETIVPAQVNSPYGGGGGGSPNITFAPTVHAIDAAGVQAFLRTYAGQMARVLQAHLNLNPSHA